MAVLLLVAPAAAAARRLHGDQILFMEDDFFLFTQSLFGPFDVMDVCCLLTFLLKIFMVILGRKFL